MTQRAARRASDHFVNGVGALQDLYKSSYWSGRPTVSARLQASISALLRAEFSLGFKYS
jgi:hypothetical protein